MAELLAAMDRALTYAETVVEAVHDGQLDDPTPCTEFSVEALIEHIVGASQFILRIIEARPADPTAAGSAADQPPVAVLRARSQALRTLWTPETLTRTFDSPLGRAPGAQIVAIAIVEFTGHGLDLALATGQPLRPGDSLGEVALQVAGAMGEHGPRDPNMIGPAVPVPADAPRWARFYGLIGRDPAWAPPAA